MRGVATISAAGAVVLATALAGCYDAHPAAGAPCDLALDNCPSGQHCIDTGEGSFCYGSKPGSLPDSSVDPGDGALPDNAPSCYGTGLVHTLCGLTPTGDLTISADRTLNTAMIGGTNCDTIVAQPGGGATLCLVSAQHISIASGAKVAVTGPNPLVLVGTMGLSIAGTLDGSSHRGGTDGPGAQASCGTGTEGGVGGPPSNGPGGGGGGAGGSFGTIGGVGGVGYHSSTNNPGGPGGTPVAITTNVTSLVGGCPGGRGGYGFGSPAAGDGPAGHGGGAIYLITTGTLTISGAVTASGAGGTGGGPGTDCSGGGGGGGAGGFIGLDAPSLAITGAVYANGGGGGGGGGTDVQFPGSVGNDPSSPTVAANGGNGGSGGGGNGGNGFAGASIAKKGNDGTGAYSGAGGGGGGAGIIKIYGTTASGGTFSPQPN